MNASQSPAVTSRSASGVVVQAHFVAGALVVEREPGDRFAITAASTDLDDAAVELDPADRAGIASGRYGRVGIGGADGRVHRQHVLDVEQQQFLVLLLVVGAEHQCVGEVGSDTCGEQLFDCLVDVRAVVDDLGDRRPGDQATLRAGVTSADGLVVAVVQEAVLGAVPDPLAGAVGTEHELGEEPGGVGPMPLGRAGVGHRLDHLVLGAQRRTQACRCAT